MQPIVTMKVPVVFERAKDGADQLEEMGVEVGTEEYIEETAINIDYICSYSRLISAIRKNTTVFWAQGDKFWVDLPYPDFDMLYQEAKKEFNSFYFSHREP